MLKYVLAQAQSPDLICEEPRYLAPGPAELRAPAGRT
jgi:hypothetical protein